MQEERLPLKQRLLLAAWAALEKKERRAVIGRFKISNDATSARRNAVNRNVYVCRLSKGAHPIDKNDWEVALKGRMGSKKRLY